LIERFGNATGVLVVLNTTFNLKGEPIVNTPANAFNTSSQSDMDCLVLGDFLIEKRVPRWVRSTVKSRAPLNCNAPLWHG
jgi:predicted NodU family carbamoyl transferase